MIFSVLAFTSLLFGIYSYIIIFNKMWYMNVEYAMWHYASEKTHSTNDEKYNLVAIGDSKMKSAFIPNEFDDEEFNTINLALGGSSFISGYYTLKEYLENNESPEYLVMGYSPGLFVMAPFYHVRTVRFQYLDNSDYKEIMHLSETIDNNETLGEGDYLDYTIYPGKYFTEFLNGITELRWFGNVEMMKILNKSKGHNYWGQDDGSTHVSEETTLEEFVPSPFINEYVEKILTMANEADIKVYWYTMPFNQPTIVEFNPKFVEGYNNHMEMLSAKYDFEVLAGIHAIDNDNFGDAYHLYKGAPMVTKTLKDALVENLAHQ